MALAALNARTLELLDEYAADGVQFEMHADGLVVAAHTEAGLDVYRQLFRELRDAGHEAELDELDADALVAAEPALDRAAVACGLHCRVDRFVRPESLVHGLAARAAELGVQLREGVEVDAIARIGSQLVAGGERVDRVVIATGVGSVPLAATLGVELPILGAKGYSITATGAGTPPSTALYLAEAKVGISGYDDAVRIAGVFELPGRDTTVEPKRIASFVRRAVGYLADWRPDEATMSSWAGLRPATPDGLPLIGEIAPGVVVASGHGMLGVTLAPATAALVAPLSSRAARGPTWRRSHPRGRRRLAGGGRAGRRAALRRRGGRARERTTAAPPPYAARRERRGRVRSGRDAMPSASTQTA